MSGPYWQVASNFGSVASAGPTCTKRLTRIALASWRFWKNTPPV